MVFVSSRLGYWVMSLLKLNGNTVCKFWLVQRLAVQFLEDSNLCSNLSLADSQKAYSFSSFPEKQKIQAFATWDTQFDLGAIFLLVSTDFKAQDEVQEQQESLIPCHWGPAMWGSTLQRRSSESWICLLASSTEKPSLRSIFLLCYQIKKPFYSPDFLNPKHNFDFLNAKVLDITKTTAVVVSCWWGSVDDGQSYT